MGTFLFGLLLLLGDVIPQSLFFLIIILCRTWFWQCFVSFIFGETTFLDLKKCDSVEGPGEHCVKQNKPAT